MWPNVLGAPPPLTTSSSYWQIPILLPGRFDPVPTWYVRRRTLRARPRLPGLVWFPLAAEYMDEIASLFRYYDLPNSAKHSQGSRVEQGRAEETSLVSFWCCFFLAQVSLSPVASCTVARSGFCIGSACGSVAVLEVSTRPFPPLFGVSVGVCVGLFSHVMVLVFGSVHRDVDAAYFDVRLHLYLHDHVCFHPRASAWVVCVCSSRVFVLCMCLRICW